MGDQHKLAAFYKVLEVARNDHDKGKITSEFYFKILVDLHQKIATIEGEIESSTASGNPNGNVSIDLNNIKDSTINIAGQRLELTSTDRKELENIRNTVDEVVKSLGKSLPSPNDVAGDSVPGPVIIQWNKCKKILVVIIPCIFIIIISLFAYPILCPPDDFELTIDKHDGSTPGPLLFSECASKKETVMIRASNLVTLKIKPVTDKEKSWQYAWSSNKGVISRNDDGTATYSAPSDGVVTDDTIRAIVMRKEGRKEAVCEIPVKTIVN